MLPVLMLPHQRLRLRVMSWGRAVRRPLALLRHRSIDPTTRTAPASPVTWKGPTDKNAAETAEHEGHE